MDPLPVLRATWLGLLRSPLWIGAGVLGLLLPSALVLLSPFPEDPGGTGLWGSVARWGLVLATLGLLLGLVRLATMAPLLARVPPRARAWGELLTLVSIPAATLLPLLAGASFARTLDPGIAGPPPGWWIGLGVAVLHLGALGTGAAQWVPSGLGRAVLLLVAVLALPALLPRDPGWARILIPFVDVGASIGYPSASLGSSAALLVALGLLLAVRFARPPPP